MQDQEITKKLADFSRKNNYQIGLSAFELTDKKNWLTYNSQQIFPAASLIKLPLALAFFDSKKDLDEKVEILEEDYFPGAGNLKNSRPKNLEIKKLLVALLQDSDNTAQNVLLRILGKRKFTAYLKKIKLTNTLFVSLREATVKKFSLTSPEEIGKLAGAISQNEFILQALVKAPADQTASFLTGRKYYHKIGRRLDGASDFLIIKSRARIFVIVSMIKNIPLASLNSPENKKRLNLLKNINQQAFNYLRRKK
jgi:beta-lactamase class A